MNVVFSLTVPHFDRSLGNLERWVDKAFDFAKDKKFDANDLLTARLAPDQYPLLRQVQTSCDTAKLTCARLAGKDVPVHADTEKTWEELLTRIRSVREIVNGFTPADLEGAEAKEIKLPWKGDKVISGIDYLSGFALPNFAFHLTHAYAILRHNGVALGKLDFIGTLPFRDA